MNTHYHSTINFPSPEPQGGGFWSELLFTVTAYMIPVILLGAMFIMVLVKNKIINF